MLRQENFLPYTKAELYGSINKETDNQNCFNMLNFVRVFYPYEFKRDFGHEIEKFCKVSDESPICIDLNENKIVRYNLSNQNANCDLYLKINGGLLCDEPGLGKTITILSLVLKTSGLLSDCHKCVNNSLHSRSPHSLRSPQSRKRNVSSDQMLPSLATLVIVPDTLIYHWMFQATSYLDSRIMRSEDVFFDSNENEPLPSANYLASCKLVVTTYRCVLNYFVLQ